MNEHFRYFFTSVISSIVGSVINAALVIYAIREKQPLKTEGYFVLAGIESSTPLPGMLKAILITVVVNAIVSGIVGGIIFKFVPEKAVGASLFQYLRGAVIGGTCWGLLLFLTWGSVCSLYFMWIKRISQFSVPVFTTSGIIAGILLLPGATIGVWLIGDHLFVKYAVEGLYEMQRGALLRLFLPIPFYAIPIGVMLGYMLVGLSSGHSVAMIFHYRYGIGIVLMLFLMTFIAVTATFNNQNYLWKSLTHNNILSIWLPYVVVWAICFLGGYEVFDRIVKRVLMVEMTTL